MDDQVDVLLAEVTEGVVVAVLPVLAGDEREPQISAGVRGGRRPGTAHRTLLRACDEAIEVFAPRLEPFNVHVDGVGELGARVGDALADDVAHRLVVRDLPTDGDGA